MNTKLTTLLKTTALGGALLLALAFLLSQASTVFVTAESDTLGGVGVASAVITATPSYTVHLPVVLRQWPPTPNYDWECPMLDMPVNNDWPPFACQFPLNEPVEGDFYITYKAPPEGYEGPARDFADKDWYFVTSQIGGEQTQKVTVETANDMYTYVYFFRNGIGVGFIEAKAYTTTPGETLSFEYVVGVSETGWILVQGFSYDGEGYPAGVDWNTWHNWSDQPYHIRFEIVD